MSLFGTSRDASLIRHINRELVNNIIEQQVGYYKINLERTEHNIYGESNGKKIFYDPVLINCLIERNDRITSADSFGPDVEKQLKFRFFRDDLANISLSTEQSGGGAGISYGIFPEVGDIDNVVENQFFMGKTPDYAYSSDNTDFGLSISIILSGHYTRSERLGISLDRL